MFRAGTYSKRENLLKQRYCLFLSESIREKSGQRGEKKEKKKRNIRHE